MVSEIINVANVIPSDPLRQPLPLLVSSNLLPDLSPKPFNIGHVVPRHDVLECLQTLELTVDTEVLTLFIMTYLRLSCGGYAVSSNSRR